ncbi:MAG: tetratricopeptide repeat protein [Candidatus Aureabacteria bacterium]|nr:tetratricopeptide repeat protein [Candidatus Auribacterota bacterium]
MKRYFVFFTLSFIFFLSFSAFSEEIDFGDKSSKTLAAKAWDALKEKNFANVDAYVNECVKNYKNKALEQQATLRDFAPSEDVDSTWALNDVATCLYIKGLALKEQEKTEEAKKVFQDISTSLSFAQCWDPDKEAFWKVGEAAEDQIAIIEKGLDFGDYSSETLTGKAWAALGAGDNDAAIIYARKCIQLYSKEAKKMQKKLEGYASKEKAFDYWALNDVGTCYLIMGDAYLAKGDKQKAMEAYKILVEDYSYAQCWDPKGWFWKPAVSARGKINKIQSESGMMY